LLELLFYEERRRDADAPTRYAGGPLLGVGQCIAGIDLARPIVETGLVRQPAKKVVVMLAGKELRIVGGIDSRWNGIVVDDRHGRDDRSARDQTFTFHAEFLIAFDISIVGDWNGYSLAVFVGRKAKSSRGKSVVGFLRCCAICRVVLQSSRRGKIPGASNRQLGGAGAFESTSPGWD
jgi:hypothetical protein